MDIYVIVGKQRTIRGLGAQNFKAVVVLIRAERAVSGMKGSSLNWAFYSLWLGKRRKKDKSVLLGENS